MDLDYLQSKSSNNNSLSNCRRVSKITAGAYTCNLCNDGYYYNGTICVQTCSTEYLIQKLTTNANILKFDTTHLQCLNVANIANCEVELTPFDNSAQACGKCKPDFVPTYTAKATNDNLFFNYNTLTHILETNSPISQYRVLDSCSSKALIQGNKGADGLVQNCAKYFITGNNEVFCIQCKIGYSGVVNNITLTGPVTYGYIPSCDAITNCDLTHTLNSTTWNEGNWVNNLNFNGITNGFWINELFSCFSCTGNRTPVIHAKLDFATGIDKMFEVYGMNPATNANLNTDTTNPSQKLIECRQLYNADGTVPTAPPSSNPGFLTGLASPNFLFGNQVGCALGWANTNGPLSITNMKCVACKPGYRPFYTSTPTVQTVWPTIDSCQAIDNCKDLQNGFVGRWMNGCYNCIHFYDYWNVSATTGVLIDFTKCVAERGNVTMTNCYAAYHSGPCMVCKKGYVKNANLECVTQTVSMCQ